MIEWFRKQRSVNELSLISWYQVSPQRTLNRSRRIIRYRDNGLSDIPDAEICKELEPKGKSNVIKKNLLKNLTNKIKHIFAYFDSPNVHSSIRIGIYGVMICPHIPIPVPCFKCQVRNLGMVKANVNLFVSIV
jgi:hypothetical protein